MRTQVQSLASLRGLGIQRCHELWCRSQMQLGFHIAVAVTGSCTSNLTPGLGTSICHGFCPKKQRRRRRRKSKVLTWSRFGIPMGGGEDEAVTPGTVGDITADRQVRKCHLVQQGLCCGWGGGEIGGHSQVQELTRSLGQEWPPCAGHGPRASAKDTHRAWLQSGQVSSK